MKRIFTLYWLDGKTEEVSGEGRTIETSLQAALYAAGYSAGALRALDYWQEKRENVIDKMPRRITFSSMAAVKS
jgi:hypothetical protein